MATGLDVSARLEKGTKSPLEPSDVLVARLPQIVAKAQYQEIWGIDLRGGAPESIRIIVQKVKFMTVLKKSRAELSLVSRSAFGDPVITDSKGSFRSYAHSGMATTYKSPCSRSRGKANMGPGSFLPYAFTRKTRDVDCHG